METVWPFLDPPNVAVITVVSILNRETPILYVSHDIGDGSWQFLPNIPITTNEARVVALKTVYVLDPSIQEIADLPLGWSAWRDIPEQPWRRKHLAIEG